MLPLVEPTIREFTVFPSQSNPTLDDSNPHQSFSPLSLGAILQSKDRALVG